MKKSKFIHASIILIIGGFFTKILGMLVKIVLTREIGTKGMGLYAMMSPTFLLLISVSGMGLTTALNVLISSKKYNVKKLMFYALIISLSLELIIIIFLFLFAHSIASNLLNNPILYYPILSMGFILPFISVSNIFRSYYFANERMYPHVISNVLEDLIKLLLILFFTKYFSDNIGRMLTFILLTNVLSELSSILIFLHYFPNFSLTKEDLKPDQSHFKAIFDIAIPTVISRLIGSITYFLEPIILTFVLLKGGFSNDYIISEYGIINGYVMPIIMLPSFFTGAISQRKLKQALAISLLIGLSYSVIIFFGGKTLLNVLYKTNEGINYLKLLLPVFIFYYLEQPLLSTLGAMNKAKINMRISFINMLIRTIGLAIFLYLPFGMAGLLIALSLNIIFTCFYASYKINTFILKKSQKNIGV